MPTERFKKNHKTRTKIKTRKFLKFQGNFFEGAALWNFSYQVFLENVRGILYPGVLF